MKNKKKKLSEARRKANEKYRKNHIDVIKKQNTNRRRKARLKKRLIKAREDEMTELFEKMKPSLFKWAIFFSKFDPNFDVDELVNAAFCHGGLRRTKNPKLWSKKIMWIIQDYMRKVRRDNSVDKIIQLYVKTYGRYINDGGGGEYTFNGRVIK